MHGVLAEQSDRPLPHLREESVRHGNSVKTVPGLEQTCGATAKAVSPQIDGADRISGTARCRCLFFAAPN
jgi:hypothetical protein